MSPAPTVSAPKLLAKTRRLRPVADFRYDARLSKGAAEQQLPVEGGPDGLICATLPHVAAEGGGPDDAAARYVPVALVDGIARGPLIAHLSRIWDPREGTGSSGSSGKSHEARPKVLGAPSSMTAVAVAGRCGRRPEHGGVERRRGLV